MPTRLQPRVIAGTLSAIVLIPASRIPTSNAINSFFVKTISERLPHNRDVAVAAIPLIHKRRLSASNFRSFRPESSASPKLLGSARLDPFGCRTKGRLEPLARFLVCLAKRQQCPHRSSRYPGCARRQMAVARREHQSRVQILFAVSLFAATSLLTARLDRKHPRVQSPAVRQWLAPARLWHQPMRPPVGRASPQRPSMLVP
jgi:hypothetical protein